MANKTKNLKAIATKIDADKRFTLEEAVTFLKENSFVKFDASVEVAYNLGLDVKQADQQIRTTIVLPNGTGKTSKVLVITQGENLKAAEAANATYAMDEEAIEKIAGGWLDFDVVVATPDMMPKLGKIARVLGPKGLMPNPKLGTVTTDIAGALEKISAGQIELRVDKEANLSNLAGKLSFSTEDLVGNLTAIHETIVKSKPAAAKGTYIKSMTVSSTMMPGLKIDVESV